MDYRKKLAPLCQRRGFPELVGLYGKTILGKTTFRKDHFREDLLVSAGPSTREVPLGTQAHRRTVRSSVSRLSACCWRGVSRITFDMWDMVSLLAASLDWGA